MFIHKKIEIKSTSDKLVGVQTKSRVNGIVDTISNILGNERTIRNKQLILSEEFY